VDLDRDGDVDVLTASTEDDLVAWHENDGRSPPVFTQRTISTANAAPMSVHAADFDGDGDVDVLAGTWDSAALLWFENDGRNPPTFIERLVGGCGGAEGIAAGRLDGDADVDALCAANVGRAVHWWENQSDHTDADGDGVRDGLDCAPADAEVFAVPSEVRAVTFTDPSTLRWGTQAVYSGPATVYEVLRGPLEALPVGPGSDETCAMEAGTSHAAALTPPTGTGHAYLVRGRNVCGAGTYGFMSSGPERTTTACP
jgi:hypothetical protein